MSHGVSIFDTVLYSKTPTTTGSISPGILRNLSDFCGEEQIHAVDARSSGAMACLVKLTACVYLVPVATAHSGDCHSSSHRQLLQPDAEFIADSYLLFDTTALAGSEPEYRNEGVQIATAVML
jgi:hypothetical protein